MREEQWEYAEVRVEYASWWRPWYCRFWLDVVSPIEGAYSGGYGNDMQHYQWEGKQARRFLEDFIAGVVGLGWEPMPQRGGDWYSYRFRRRVAPQGPPRFTNRRDGP